MNSFLKTTLMALFFAAVGVTTSSCTLSSSPSSDLVHSPSSAGDEWLFRVVGMGSQDSVGYINRSGKVIIPTTYKWGSEFSDGEAIAGMGKHIYFIDSRGRITFVAPSNWTAFGGFSEGLTSVNIGGELDYFNVIGGDWAYVNQRGQIIINLGTIVDGELPLGKFTEGLACVRIKDQWGYVNGVGKFVVRPTYATAGEFHEGLAAVRTTEGKFGYINKHGEWAIHPQFDDATAFHQGFAGAIGDNWKWSGIIDPHGHHVLTCDYNCPGNCVTISSDDRLAAFFPATQPSDEDAFHQHGLLGFLRMDGSVAIRPRFRNGFNFQEGLAAVQDKNSGLWGFIAVDGKMVILPQFAKVKNGGFDHGLAEVELPPTGLSDSAPHSIRVEPRGPNAYINHAGKVVWRESQ